MFPLSWYREFLREIRRRDIEILTYRDLFADSDDWDYESHYLAEYEAWLERRDPKRIYLLIQHDVDLLPEFTRRMVALEMQHEIRSNIFLFHERFSRREKTPVYDVDHAFFRGAEAAGFVIGYHQNALQLAGFDLERAVERYRADVAALREHYCIEFVVPHGGMGVVIDGVKRHNHDVPMPPELAGSVRWMYNRYGARFPVRWSDGGLRKCRDLERIRRTDLIGVFLDGLRPGSRNFCLVHPQRWGFHVQPDSNPLLAAEPWYRALCERSDALIAPSPPAHRGQIA